MWHRCHNDSGGCTRCSRAGSPIIILLQQHAEPCMLPSQEEDARLLVAKALIILLHNHISLLGRACLGIPPQPPDPDRPGRRATSGLAPGTRVYIGCSYITKVLQALAAPFLPGPCHGLILIGCSCITTSARLAVLALLGDPALPKQTSIYLTCCSWIKVQNSAHTKTFQP